MRFEARELKPYGEFVRSAQLVVGRTYFRVSFLDREMLLPEMVPLVFIGRDLTPDKPGLYFQDAASYMAGLKYPIDWSAVNEDDPSSNPEPASARFETMPEREFTIVFDYDAALDQLLACSIRRGNAT